MTKNLLPRLCVTFFVLTLCLALRPAAAHADVIPLDIKSIIDSGASAGTGWSRRVSGDGRLLSQIELLEGYTFTITSENTGSFLVKNAGTIINSTIFCKISNSGTISECEFKNTVNNSGTISKCTFRDIAINATKGQILDSNLFSYARGFGRYSNCTLINDGLSNSTTSSIYMMAPFDHCTFESDSQFDACTFDNCIFKGNVILVSNTFFTNDEYPVALNDCTFFCEPVTVSRRSYIGDGTLNTTVNILQEGTIYGGTFNKTVNIEAAYINGGTFNQTVLVGEGSLIEGGTFFGDVINSGNIIGGTFFGNVINRGTISGGTFRGSIKNDGGEIVTEGLRKKKFGIKLELTNLTVIDQPVDGVWLDAPAREHFTFTLACTNSDQNLPDSIEITNDGSLVNKFAYSYNAQTGQVTISAYYISESFHLVVTATTESSPLEGVTLSTNSPQIGKKIVAEVAPENARASYQWYWTNQVGSTMAGTPINFATSNVYTPDSSVQGKYLYVVATGISSMTGRVKAAAANAVLDASYNITCNPASFDFGAKDEYYLFRPSKKTITVTNTGNAPIELAPFGDVDDYEVIPSSNWTSPFLPGASRSFTVQPVAGLASGTHSVPITVSTTFGSSAVFTPTFTVNPGPDNPHGVISLNVSELNDTSKTDGNGWQRKDVLIANWTRKVVVLEEGRTFRIIGDEDLRVAIQNCGTLINSTWSKGSIFNMSTIIDCTFSSGLWNYGSVTGSTLKSRVNNYGTIDNCFCTSSLSNYDNGTVTNSVMNNSLSATPGYEFVSIGYNDGSFSNCTFDSPIDMSRCTVNDSTFTIGSTYENVVTSDDCIFNNCSASGGVLDFSGKINSGIYDCYLSVAASNRVASGISGGTFYGTVEVGYDLPITGGTFFDNDSPLINSGNISGGTFYTDVRNFGIINGGTYYGTIRHENTRDPYDSSRNRYYEFYPERCYFGIKTSLKTDMHTVPAANDGWLVAKGGQDYTFRLVSNFGDILPRTITITKGGKALNLNEAYTYNSTTGEITIFSKYITAGDLTVSANLLRGRITGVVQNDASPVGVISGATVNVYHGQISPCDACVTDEYGEFEFNEIPYGTYSLVATWDDTNNSDAGQRTTTQILRVDSENVTSTLVIPVLPLNTIVETKGGLAVAASGLIEQRNAVARADNEGITQDDLDKLDDGGQAKIDLSLAATELSGAAAEEDKATIEATLDTGEEVALLVDLTVNKGVTDSTGNRNEVTLTQLQKLVDIYVTLPDSLVGLTQLTVKRIHDDEVQTLPLGSALSTTECYFIDDTELVLRVQQFSTYAAAGPGSPTTDSAKANASDSGDDVPKTGDASMPMLWAGLVLFCGAHLVTCVRRRRRNG